MVGALWQAPRGDARVGGCQRAPVISKPVGRKAFSLNFFVVPVLPCESGRNSRVGIL